MGTIPFDMPDEPRRSRRRRGIGYAAVVLVAAGWLASAGGALGEAEQQAIDPTPAADRDLWDRVRTMDLPDYAWESAATGLGLAIRGPWISADGLTWEHLDGRVVEVAKPRDGHTQDETTGAHE
jgi:hypothetical protein